jgi:hypothetical protein
MRKTRIILISLILMMTLSSCDTVNTDITTPSPSLTEAATGTAVIPSPTDVPSETPIQTETAVTPTPSATPFITPTQTENPGPKDIELDFLNDKFDKVEVLVDGSYVDVSGIWESLKEIMGKPVFRHFHELDRMTISNKIRFIKDGKEFMLSPLNRTNTAYRGSDYGTVSYQWSNTILHSSYYIPNISLFYAVLNINYLERDDEMGLVLKEYLGGDVFQMMYDSKVLKHDDSYIWTPKKTVPIYNIAKYMKNSIDAKPNNLVSYTIVRNYTYIYSVGIHILLDIYGKDESGKGVYANVKYGDNDIWMVLDCSILDFDNGLSVNDAYHVPSGAVPVRDDEWFNGYEKMELVYGDMVVDMTEYWYKYSNCVKICDWETYLSGPALSVDYVYRMTKNGTVKTMGVSDMYDYFISEGDGLYYCDYLASYRNAFIMTEEEAVIEGFLNRSIYQKMFQCAVLDITQVNVDQRVILTNQRTNQLATSLAFRITEKLTGKPDIEITKRSESTCYYKGEAISVIAWDIPGDGYNAGYVNILSGDTDIWLKIQSIQFLLGFLGVNGW